MTQDMVRTRRNFPAETWAVVRDAYLGGETAESIARRLNMSVNTIRKRAGRCGWTHAAHARAIQRARDAGPAAPADLAGARDAAVAHAAALLGEGRALEASAMLRAAEALGRAGFGEAGGGEAGAETETSDADAAVEETLRQISDHIDRIAAERASQLALDLLTDEGPPQAVYSAFAFRWRAWVLGPAVALADFAQGIRGGWASRYWDAEGRLIPQDPVPPLPDPGMVRQHLRLCRAAAGGEAGDGDWVWPPKDWWGAGGDPPDETIRGDAEPGIRRL